MKRVSFLVLVGIALSAAFLPVSSHVSVSAGTWHVYTFAQAVKAGVEPSFQEQLKQSGLPLCGTKGPTSARARAALKKVIARNDGDTCMADPRGTTISVCQGSGCIAETGMGAETLARQEQQAQGSVIPGAAG